MRAIAVLLLVGQVLWLLVILGLIFQYVRCGPSPYESCEGPTIVLALAIGAQVLLTPFSIGALVVAWITRDDW